MQFKSDAILRRLANLYVISILVYLIWVLFFDADSVLNIIRVSHRVTALERKKEYYLQQIKLEEQKLHELKDNAANLETFARENYYMRGKDEDLFIVVEE